MYHTGYLSFVFCFDRNTVASVSHSDHCVLKVITCASVYKRGQLGMDSVSGDLHISANLTQGAAGIITDLIFRKNTSADFCSERSKRLQCIEHPIQRIRKGISAITSGIGLDAVGIFKHAADGKKFTDSQ